VGPVRRRATTAARTPDALAVTAVAWARVIIASAVAAAGSVPAHLSDADKALFLLVGLAYVPWSVVVLFASERRSSQLALLGGPIGDVLLLLSCALLAPQSTETVLAGFLVVIAFAAYTVGRRFASSLAIAGLALTLVARSLADPDEQVEIAVLVMFAVAAVAILVLIERTSSLQARASARADRLQSASDAVLARIADGVVVTDAFGTVVSCNPAAERIVGAPSARVVGQPCAAVLRLAEGETPFDCSTGCRLLALQTDATAVLGREVWRAAPDRRQPILANATGIIDDSDTLLEVVHSLRDITKIKESEEAKTLFLATASHELKTPLTVIRGFAEAMLESEMDPARRRVALDAIHRRTLELGRIVDRLLLSSRIEAGHIELFIRDVPLREILEDRALALGAATGRVVEVVIDPEVTTVRGEDAAIATVFEHLIDNAVKYSPDGGSVRVRADVGDGVVVTVGDEGIGMDAEQAAHCFEKFWQAESGDVRRFGGTGIGLYIVRSLVEAMGGRISVRSTLGAGTTFVVDLLPGGASPTADGARRGVGESTMIREFMRQIGVPERRPG
jgi:PAS domain S-box-containing protein